MGTYVIQRLVSIADVGALDAELSAVRAVATVMTAAGRPLRVLHATYVAAVGSFQCVVDAEDSATVTEALRRVGSHTARVLPALAL
jgi:phage-related minor tail protein